VTAEAFASWLEQGGHERGDVAAGTQQPLSAA
jgi:hypothetical protein